MNITTNLTLNSQISYWKGQKRHILLDLTQFIVSKFKPNSVRRVYTYVTRFGLSMNGLLVFDRVRRIKRIIIMNPNNAPPVERKYFITNRKSWLNSMRIRYYWGISVTPLKGTLLGIRKFIFYKTQSLLKLRKQNNEIESYN